jgi:hypothetical protein
MLAQHPGASGGSGYGGERAVHGIEELFHALDVFRHRGLTEAGMRVASELLEPVRNTRDDVVSVSVREIQHRSGLSRSGARKGLRQVLATGCVHRIWTGNGRGHRSMYWINFTALQQADPGPYAVARRQEVRP